MLQRCPKEPQSPSRFKEVARRGPDWECEGAGGGGGGYCLTPRGGEGRPGGRKRPPTSASEQEEEEEEEEGDWTSHTEKRARVAAGEYHRAVSSWLHSRFFGFFLSIISFMLSSKSGWIPSDITNVRPPKTVCFRCT